MIVLGIDPGIAITGYAVLQGDESQMKPLCYGSIQTPSTQSTSERLATIYSELNRIILEYHPIEIAVEELFFSRNVTTALIVGQARGVVLLSAQQQGLRLTEYKPMEVKLAVTGYGAAAKKQVQQMVKILLRLTETPKPDDTADALAIAICHLQSRKLKSLGMK